MSSVIPILPCQVHCIIPVESVCGRMGAGNEGGGNPLQENIFRLNHLTKVVE